MSATENIKLLWVGSYVCSCVCVEICSWVCKQIPYLQRECVTPFFVCFMLLLYREVTKDYKLVIVLTTY
jgi:hypothetical protein